MDAEADQSLHLAHKSFCWFCHVAANILSQFVVQYSVFHIDRDTICDLGGASELANYGEYSGAPSEQQTYEYAKTVLGLMTQEKHPQGIVLG